MTAQYGGKPHKSAQDRTSWHEWHEWHELGANIPTAGQPKSVPRVPAPDPSSPSDHLPPVRIAPEAFNNAD